VNNLKVKQNFCTCHPDTCSCDPWLLVSSGKTIARAYRRQGLDIIVEKVESQDIAIKALSELAIKDCDYKLQDEDNTAVVFFCCYDDLTEYCQSDCPRNKEAINNFMEAEK
jgi:hypothetical protein